MYDWEARVLLRHYLDQGLTLNAIAERVGWYRRTIRCWIAAGAVDREPAAVA